MKVFIMLALVNLGYANITNITPLVIEGNTAYGYIQNYAFPLGKKIRKAEEMSKPRIVGGSLTGLNPLTPYLAGLLISVAGFSGAGVCGAALITSNRVITSAHCWFDGVNRARRFTVVLGSNTLFSGGTRLSTSNVTIHPNWRPKQARDDVAVIYLPNSVPVSDTISYVPLPSGSALGEKFVGSTADASSFGLRSGGDGSISSGQLSFESEVISNNICSVTFPQILQNSNICTSGVKRRTCSDDSGGPLVTKWNGKQFLIGVMSFNSALGCRSHLPAAFARVTSYVDFFNQHI